MNSDIIIGRQPILDKNSTIIGYELLFRSHTVQISDIEDDRYATSKVVTDALNVIGLDDLIGNKTAFINVDKEFLLNPALEAIPADRFIFEILEHVVIDEEIVERMQSLHELGYLFALDDFDFSINQLKNFQDILPYISIVKIDLSLSSDIQILDKKVDFFKEKKIALLAEKVETKMEHERFLNMGFEYFQGYFFAKPDIIEGKKINPSKLALIQIIKHIIANESPKTIEAELIRSPEISINLLRYLNSASFGIKREISSIKQAISLLGMRPLLKWLTLMLYAADEKTPHAQALLEQVLLRAELMQLLSQTQNDPSVKDKAYFTGLISMLDAVLHKDIKEILDEMSFEEEIQEAILHQSNLLGKLLKLSTCLEHATPLEELKNCNELNLEANKLAQTLSQAYTAVLLHLQDMKA